LSDLIKFIAGRRAAQIIRDEGLKPDRIRVLVGAAGGAKSLVLGGIDRVLATSLFKKRKEPLFVLGSSIGTWRFAALSQNDRVEALDTFEKAYMNQSYASRPTPKDVSLENRKILNRYLDDSKVKEILSHPFMRLNLIAARSKNLLSSDNSPILASGMALASLFNFLSRSSLFLFFERTLFYDKRDIPPFFDMKGFRMTRVPLSTENLKQSIMASGSVPLVMEGIRDIPGAPAGQYRDGGLIDYHIALPFDPDPDRIVLYPHYSERLTPGWLDKHLPWRRAHADILHNVLIVCPSERFTERLPYGKIPDRSDFKRFFGRDDERLAYWNRAAAEGRILGAEFMNAVESKSIKKLIVEYE
jgi:hypothetical protein